MNVMSDEVLLREIEPQLMFGYEEHMKIRGSDPIDTTYALAEIAHTVGPTISTNIGTEPDSTPGGYVDVLEVSPILRKSLFTDIIQIEEQGVDVRPVAAASFLVGLLTEDNLPYYTEENGRKARLNDTLYMWLREWTSEEYFHSIFMREWGKYSQMIGKLVSHAEYQQGVVSQLRGGMNVRINNIRQGFAYLSLQELATRVSHHNSGWTVDRLGRRMYRKTGGQELLHHKFYTAGAAAMLDADPDATVIAIHDQYTGEAFSMPGEKSIPGFKPLAAKIAIAGILDGRILNQLKADIIDKLDIEGRTFSSDKAKAAQEALVALLDPKVQDDLGRHDTLEKRRERDIEKARKAGKWLPFILGKTVRPPVNESKASEPGKEPVREGHDLIVMAA